MIGERGLVKATRLLGFFTAAYFSHCTEREERAVGKEGEKEGGENVHVTSSAFDNLTKMHIWVNKQTNPNGNYHGSYFSPIILFPSHSLSLTTFAQVSPIFYPASSALIHSDLAPRSHISQLALRTE